jgi:hypothetical protein
MPLKEVFFLFLVGLLFDIEDGSDMLLRNVGFQPGYTEVYLIRLNFSYSQL